MTWSSSAFSIPAKNNPFLNGHPKESYDLIKLVFVFQRGKTEREKEEEKKGRWKEGM